MSIANIADQKDESLKRIKSVTPATGEVIEEYQEMSRSEAAAIVDAAHIAFQDWRKTSFEERSKLMNKAADVLKDRKEELAKLMTAEMGKVHKEAISEIEKCAWVCKYY